MVSASVRAHGISPAIAEWVTAHLSGAEAMTIDPIDLATTSLPADEHLLPGGGPRSEVADRIEAADAFVFVTPEYNHSYPASLKRLIDWHYHEWMFKPATIVAYGSQGGHAAAEHLRGVLAELHVVTTRQTLNLRSPWTALDDGGRFVPGENLAATLSAALDELTWWADTLTPARTTRPFTG
ncbi:NADPH-dependent FMN reductase [Microbacterium sp. AGC85]